MVDQPLLLFRADAQVRMGTGHVMRCLALAQAWQEQGGRALFVMAEGWEMLAGLLHKEGLESQRLAAPAGSLEDAREFACLAHDLGAERVVVDGYQFDEAYQQYLVDENLQLLWIDDYGHAARYSAHWVLNQNIYATQDIYQPRAERTELLLSTRFALLRREFAPWIGWERPVGGTAAKVLVTLGGSDPDNMTLKVIEALSRLETRALDALVIAGAANPHYGLLEEACAQTAGRISLVRSVSDMPERMAWADLAVTAGGSTCWEAAFMGLPSLVVVLAENQVTIARYLNDRGLVRSLGRGPEPEKIVPVLEAVLRDPEVRAEMTRQGQSAVDGLGARRVAEIMLQGNTRDSEERHEAPVLRQ